MFDENNIEKNTIQNSVIPQNGYTYFKEYEGLELDLIQNIFGCFRAEVFKNFSDFFI